jgi:hypothetical protein
MPQYKRPERCNGSRLDAVCSWRSQSVAAGALPTDGSGVMRRAVPQERLKAMEHIRTADPHAFHEKVRPGDPDGGAAAAAAESAAGAAAAVKAAAKAVAAAKASAWVPLPAAAASFQHHVRGMMNQERAIQIAHELAILSC